MAATRHNFEFDAPTPYMLVAWRQMPADDPCPALVTATFGRTISCTVFPVDFPHGIPKDGVRHIADPIASHMDPYDAGGYWDFTADQKMLHLIAGDPVDAVTVKR